MDNKKDEFIDEKKAASIMGESDEKTPELKKEKLDRR